ncbi:unnamed protein product [Larinioides sclopetarius]|uniref:Uncharacterized protein n=1 Tax=Larinioides sclopetarius TaxID=280406 RepID=A0AAV2ABG4_9ARAC
MRNSNYFRNNLFIINMTVIEGISPKQQKVIDELRRRTINIVLPEMLEDELLFYRFAKARDFNLLDAEAMIRKIL